MMAYYCKTLTGLKNNVVLREDKEQAPTITSKCIDHLGLVAAAIDRLGIVQQIDQRIPVNKAKGAQLTHGQRVKAMILNGLGYVRAPLYMTSRFFENKSLPSLLGADVECSALNDQALGRTLDVLDKYGTTRLFGEIAINIAQSQGLLGHSLHLDTTSLVLYGNYEQVTPFDTTTPAYGHSKAHRNDLKQMVMSMTANGPAGIPVWFEALPGNSSDKKSFHETIAVFEDFRQSMAVSDDFIWVADSALWNESKLQKAQYNWLTRIPNQVNAVKDLLALEDDEIGWQKLDENYSCAQYINLQEDGEQVWTLYYSKHQRNEAFNTLTRKIGKAFDKAKTESKKLANKEFDCETDARKDAEQWQAKLPFHRAEFKIEAIKQHKKRGRPTKNAQPILKYQICATVYEDESKIAPHKRKLGRFVLATNDVNGVGRSAKRMLSSYKEQDKVERGFAFCKTDEFQLDHIFLKMPSRINALMMIMALTLLVYNSSEYQMRAQMKANGETLPNQLGQEIETPTLRWVFQILQGIHVVSGPHIGHCITGMTELKERAIRLFGTAACKIYGIKP